MKTPSPAALAGEHDNFMRSIAALHSVIVSLSSSIIFSLVRRFLELEEMKNIFYMNIHVLIDHKQNFSYSSSVHLKVYATFYLP